MAVDISHPAVRAVLGALDNPELTVLVRALADRDDEVIAVVMESDSVRHTVIVQQRQGESGRFHTWLAAGDGTPVRVHEGRRPGRRSSTTACVVGLAWRGRSAATGRLASGDGLAAEDAVAVAVVTAHDAYEAEVGRDGFFATLARAAWRETPLVSVRLHDGDVVDVQL